jgi:hypothetical protein
LVWRRGFDELSADEIDHIERSRARTGRREWLTEAAVSEIVAMAPTAA